VRLGRHAMKMLGRGGGSAGQAVYRAMLSVPGLLDAVHFSALRTGNGLARTADALARRRLVPALLDYLDRNTPDLLLSVLATGSAAGVHVLAVAGRNERLARKLAAVAGRQPRIRAFGFTDRIPDLMSAADLVITTPSETCLEARIVGRPLLLLDVLQGHGRDNLQHELELGAAMVTSAGAADVTRSALAALDRVEPATAGPARSQADWESAFTAALGSCGL
jgi:Glycosyltransferase family 28 C-terminal domain